MSEFNGPHSPLNTECISSGKEPIEWTVQKVNVGAPINTSHTISLKYCICWQQLLLRMLNLLKINLRFHKFVVDEVLSLKNGIVAIIAVNLHKICSIIIFLTIALLLRILFQLDLQLLYLATMQNYFFYT